MRCVCDDRLGTSKKKKKSTGGGTNSLQSEKCVRAVANYHLRFSNELAGHGAGLQHCCPFHVQHGFPTMTPMLVVANDLSQQRLGQSTLRQAGWMPNEVSE
jgi:hypothetical protein